MSKNNIITGLDIGTTAVRTVIARIKNDSKPQIIGVGEFPSIGLRRGAVVDIDETVKSIAKSIEGAERTSGVSVNQAYVSIGGSHIFSRTSKGVVAISRADGEVSGEDVSRVINAASAVSLPPNREVVHIIPREFTIDGQQAIKDPLGMSGVRLEVDTLIIEGASPFIKNLNKCVREADIEIKDLVLGPLAASRSVLDKRQKELGVAVLDIGGGTVGLSVFEEGDIVHSCVLPIGASHITNDIAIGLRTTIDLAEKIKIEFGFAYSSEISKKDVINLAKIEKNEEGNVPRKHIAEIMEARCCEMFELVNKELRKIDRQGLLPAGVVLVGGGAKIPGIIDLAKEQLRLPAQVGFPVGFGGIADKLEDPAYATVLGLILWGMDAEVGDSPKGISRPNIPSVANTVSKMKKWFRNFLP